MASRSRRLGYRIETNSAIRKNRVIRPASRRKAYPAQAIACARARLNVRRFASRLIIFLVQDELRRV